MGKRSTGKRALRSLGIGKKLKTGKRTSRANINYSVETILPSTPKETALPPTETALPPTKTALPPTETVDVVVADVNDASRTNTNDNKESGTTSTANTNDDKESGTPHEQKNSNNKQDKDNLNIIVNYKSLVKLLCDNMVCRACKSKMNSDCFTRSLTGISTNITVICTNCHHHSCLKAPRNIPERPKVLAEEKKCDKK